ncbi:hypothetical protein KBX61_05480 [Lacticaseibacillus paracasei]|nr:hypothetical protein [Lacticaseibacillus paracasei]MCP9346596.1 hypothetical protein [Lacticaseibacillus paracasei]MCP9365550.1 hypothetical protein [Lacticaseibacillus paracasei]MCP9377949.1 hypothetical protein [Lacticaseibacillus paracasei]
MLRTHTKKRRHHTASLSKEQKKALIAKVEKERQDHPEKKSKKSGFETIDEEAERLESEN